MVKTVNPTTSETVGTYGTDAETASRRADIYEVANNAGQRVREFVNTAGDEISHLSDNVSTQIRTKPVQSSMIALGVGLIMGMLLKK